MQVPDTRMSFTHESPSKTITHRVFPFFDGSVVADADDDADDDGGRVEQFARNTGGASPSAKAVEKCALQTSLQMQLQKQQFFGPFKHPSCCRQSNSVVNHAH